MECARRRADPSSRRDTSASLARAVICARMRRRCQREGVLPPDRRQRKQRREFAQFFRAASAWRDHPAVAGVVAGEKFVRAFAGKQHLHMLAGEFADLQHCKRSRDRRQARRDATRCVRCCRADRLQPSVRARDVLSEFRARFPPRRSISESGPPKPTVNVCICPPCNSCAYAVTTRPVEPAAKQYADGDIGAEMHFHGIRRAWHRALRSAGSELSSDRAPHRVAVRPIPSSPSEPRQNRRAAAMRKLACGELLNVAESACAAMAARAIPRNPDTRAGSRSRLTHGSARRHFNSDENANRPPERMRSKSAFARSDRALARAGCWRVSSSAKREHSAQRLETFPARETS